MKRFFAVIILFGACLFIHAQENLSVNDYWTLNGDMPNALYEHIRGYAFDQLKERWSYVDGLKTGKDWVNRQVEVRKKMEEIVGIFP